MRLGRLTANLALRFDRGSASMNRSPQAASPGFPGLLPAIVAPAEADLIEVSLLSPRLGATYALDEAGRTLLRASYGLFGSQVGSGTVQNFSAASQAVLIYNAVDANHNDVADPGELTRLTAWQGVDPTAPGSSVNFNRVSPGLTSPRTHEVVIGIDREVMRDLGVSAVVHLAPLRRRLLEQPRPDQRQHHLPADRRDPRRLRPGGRGRGDGAGPRQLQPAVLRRWRPRCPRATASEFRNRPGYHQRYLGFEVQATKRMANRWMGRVGFSTNSHREFFDNPSAAVQDPTASTTWPNIPAGVHDADVRQRQEREST